MDFLVARDDIRRCRFDEAPHRELGPGQVLLEVRVLRADRQQRDLRRAWATPCRTGASSRRQDGWGRVPVWGFAASSPVAAIAECARASASTATSRRPPTCVVHRGRVGGGGLSTARPTGRTLPAVYNPYARAGPRRGLGGARTGSALPAALRHLVPDRRPAGRRGCFGARRVVMSSASSKTALGTAFLLSRRGEVRGGRPDLRGRTPASWRASASTTAW